MNRRSTAYPDSASESAIAQPETTETSCSAEGPPSRTTIARASLRRSVARSRRVGHRVAHLSSCSQLDQSPRNWTSYTSSTPNLRRLRRGRSPPGGGCRRRSRRRSLTMKLACLSLIGRPADAAALEPGGIDQPAGGVARRVAEDAAGAGQIERLMVAAPAPDLVQASLDRGRIGRSQQERGLEDDLAGRCGESAGWRRATPLPHRVLEPAVAVRQAERGRRLIAFRCRPLEGRGPTRRPPRCRARAPRRWPRRRRRPCPGWPGRTRGRPARPAEPAWRRGPAAARLRR